MRVMFSRECFSINSGLEVHEKFSVDSTTGNPPRLRAGLYWISAGRSARNCVIPHFSFPGYRNASRVKLTLRPHLLSHLSATTRGRSGRRGQGLVLQQ